MNFTPSSKLGFLSSEEGNDVTTDCTHLIVFYGQLRSLCSQEEGLCLLELSLLKGKLCLSDKHISHAVWVMSLSHTLRSIPVLVMHKPGGTRCNRDMRRNRDDKEQPSAGEATGLALHGESRRRMPGCGGHLHQHGFLGLPSFNEFSFSLFKFALEERKCTPSCSGIIT